MEKFVELIKSILYHEFVVFVNAARTLKGLSAFIGDEYSLRVLDIHKAASGDSADIVIECIHKDKIAAYKFTVWFSSYGTDVSVSWDSLKEVKQVTKTVTVWE